MTNDLLERFIFETAPVRGEFVQLEASLQTILAQHSYPPPLRRLLSESLCVAALLSAIIKFEGRLTVQFRGKGKLKLLLAQCDNNFHLRGLAKWDSEHTYEELLQSFNQGVLMIMLDSGGKGRYQGVVAWRGNSLVESIEGYFIESEQLATRIWLAVSENKAAGLLLQTVPGHNKMATALESLSSDSQWQQITQQTANLTKQDMLALDYQRLLHKLYPNQEIRIFPSVPVTFQCTCSRKKGEDAIMLLGREEAEAELNDKQSIVVTCDFCNKEYLFDRVDVAKIFDSHDGVSTNLH